MTEALFSRSGGPEAETFLAFGHLMEATNLPAFKYLEMQKITDLQSAWFKISLPDFSKIIFFPDFSLTTQIPWLFPVFPWPVGGL